MHLRVGCLNFYKNHFEHYIAAPSFSLHEKNLSAALVEVQQPEEDPAITLYRAKVKNGSPQQACTIMACINPLTCEISGLTLGANYTVEVKACVSDENGCSEKTESDFSIKPTGKWKAKLYCKHSIYVFGFTTVPQYPF